MIKKAEPKENILLYTALNMAGLGNRFLHLLEKESFPAPSMLDTSSPFFRRIKKLFPEHALRLARVIDDGALSREVNMARGHGIEIMIPESENYPERLKHIASPPLVLYSWGRARPGRELSVSLVGTRRPSHYGISCAGKFSFELASCGFEIVSGFARGIDITAHLCALKAKGATTAVLGTGLLNPYPKENIKFLEKIRSEGCLLSEFPLNTHVLRHNFPRRNRIVSGLSLATIVVEAPLKSGALITAAFALEQGREVFSIPGNIDSFSSKGSNALIKEGAVALDCPYDVIRGLEAQIKYFLKKRRNTEGPVIGVADEGPGKKEAAVWGLLGRFRDIESLMTKSGLSIKDLSQILLRFEIEGKIKKRNGILFKTGKGQ